MKWEFTKDVTRLLLAIVFLHCVSFTDGSNCDNSISSVSICRPASQRGRTVHLTGVLDNDDGIGCGCTLQLVNDNSGPGTISIANITSAPSNCDYDIDTTYKTNVKRIFSCGNYEQNVQFELIQSEEVVVGLQKGSSNVGAVFCLEITSTAGSEVNIECSKTSAPTVPTIGTNTDSNTNSSAPNTDFSQTSSEDETGFIVGIILAVIIFITLISLVVCVLYKKKKGVKNVVVPGDAKQIKQ